MSLLNAAQGVINATSPLPWLIVSGQPSDAQFTALHAGGVSTIIDLRDPMEPRPFDEPAVVRAAGMSYVNAPVVSGALDDAMMGRALGALRAARGKPAMLHCNSANRTGGPLLAYLMLDEGMDEATAVEVVMRSGLRSAELLDWALDYVKRENEKKR